ncbi:PTS system trehalose-specific EIIBC component [uncultured Anaerococcus sp.]|uniref:PTS system trehalose-specific EIIBC component n=1 Tax=uncultured Anaerococcus sp. TaxID=293428 RepID=UPI00288C2DC2|nr:PTS system trehalose-specific EIIBC component [uncultured Anaerococcus sp.]
MGKYVEDSKKLLEYIGGKENVSAVTHCVTRMRFVLNDPKKADIEKIEEIGIVKGTFTQSGQFQVIIGNEVSDFYNDFVAVSGIEGVSKAQVKEASKSNQNKLQKLMGDLGEIFAPIIPALICGGLILGFRNVIDQIAMFENGTKTLVEISQFWAGVDSFLWLIGEAVFHFLPVAIVWSITRKMGTSQILGIILGITLVSPQLLNAYAVAGTAPADIPVWDFGSFKIQMIGYQAQVIPAILAGFVLVYLEKFFRRVSPSYVSMIVVPFFSLVPAVIIAHTVVGPIGWKIGDWISQGVWAGLTSNFKWIFALFFGFIYAPLVITGLHHMTNAIDVQLANTFGGTLLWPMIALSNIAQGSAVLGMIYLQRKNEKSKEINIPACISCYLGVTEPAMFGVNLKHSFPFISAMIGSALAALFSVSTGVMASSIGVGGLPGILSIKPGFWIRFAIAMAIAIVVPLILTISLGQKKLSPEDKYGKDKYKEENSESEASGEVLSAGEFDFVAPMTGRVLDLSDVEDKVFSDRIMGDGFAIELTESDVVSPVDGVVAMTYPSKHAFGLKADSGEEILIHIGMDTVELNGKGFESFVETNDRVKKGDLLCKVDLDYVRGQGKSLVSPIIFTTGEKVKLLDKETVKENEEIIEVER